MHGNKKNKDKEKEKLLNFLIGSYRKIYIGYAKDKKLRYECSSGGIATSLLKYLVETKTVDGAIIVTPIPSKPLKYKSSYVNKIEDIIENKGSVYCPVDISPVWRIIKENYNKKLVIVGLPCQLRAVDKFLTKNSYKTIILKIGLFCGGVSYFKALEYLCKRKKIKSEDILNIRYRSGGWPGRRIIAVVNDDSRPSKYKEIVLLDREASFLQRCLYNFCFSGTFFLDSCRKCEDQTSEYADISIGDAWIPEITSINNAGTSLVITRTDIGYKVIQDAIKSGIILLEETNPTDIVRSQGSCLIGRKLGLWGGSFLKYSSNTFNFKLCKKYFPNYIPSRRLVLERKFFQWLASHFPVSIVFFLYLVHRLVFSIIRKLVKVIIKIFK